MDNWNTKQKVIIQGICLLLSIGLWFYVTNSENPVVTNEINRIPVEVINTEHLIDSKLILTPNQNFYVSLKIEGLSQDVRRVSKSDFKIQVDLIDYALKIGENKIPVTIVDWPSNINVKNDSGLTITILIEEYVQKEVDVKSNIQVVAQDNHYVAAPTFNPSKVVVSGPSSFVESVDSVIAEGQEENVTETIVKDYPIYAVDVNGNSIKGVTLSQETVETTININQGKVVPIKLNIVGTLSSNLKLNSIIPSNENVQINGPKEVLDTIGEISTSQIDLATITDDAHIDVSLIGPEGVQLDTQTVTVTVDVEKIATKDISVPFTVIGAVEGVKVVTNVESINVKVSGFQAELDKLSPDNIKVELDVSKHTESGKFSEKPKETLVNVGESIVIENIDKIDFEIIKEESTPTE